MFSFTPKTDEEIERLQNPMLMDEGIYPFKVKDVLHGTSEAGNQMLTVSLYVTGADKQVRLLKDYLPATDKMMFKIKHFCDTVGVADQYALGSLDIAGLIGRSGQVAIGIEKGKPKEDGTGFYPDRNKIKGYIKAPLPDFVDDVIPF